MLVPLHNVFSLVEEPYVKMSSLETFQLTHPELLSETELREILKNRCIDFSNYERLSRSQLIEMYKRVALPLPQRQQASTADLNAETNTQGRNFTGDIHINSVSSTMCNLKRNISETTRMPQSSNIQRSKLHPNEFNHVSKKIRSSNSRNGAECNGIDKRNSDGKHDESPSKKRQKITWP